MLLHMLSVSKSQNQGSRDRVNVLGWRVRLQQPLDAASFIMIWQSGIRETPAESEHTCSG